MPTYILSLTENPNKDILCLLCAADCPVFDVFKGRTFVISSDLDQVSERTKCQNHFMVKSIDFVQCMTSEGTETLIFAFTSKTGQSGAHNRHKIFLFGFFSVRHGYLKAFYGPNFRHQT